MYTGTSGTLELKVECLKMRLKVWRISYRITGSCYNVRMEFGRILMLPYERIISDEFHTNQSLPTLFVIYI